MMSIVAFKNKNKVNFFINLLEIEHLKLGVPLGDRIGHHALTMELIQLAPQRNGYSPLGTWW